MNNLTFTALDHSPIPTGDYVVKVSSINEAESKYEGRALRIDLVIDEGPATGHRLAYWVNVPDSKLSMKSKLVRMCQAFGLSVSNGQQFNVADVVDKRAVATVIVKTNDDGSTFNKIDELRELPAISI